jgi:hypothetical protein
MKYQYIIIALLGVILTVLIEQAGVVHFLEMKALDVRYELPSQYFQHYCPIRIKILHSTS